VLFYLPDSDSERIAASQHSHGPTPAISKLSDSDQYWGPRGPAPISSEEENVLKSVSAAEAVEPASGVIKKDRDVAVAMPHDSPAVISSNATVPLRSSCTVQTPSSHTVQTPPSRAVQTPSSRAVHGLSSPSQAPTPKKKHNHLPEETISLFSSKGFSDTTGNRRTNSATTANRPIPKIAFSRPTLTPISALTSGLIPKKPDLHKFIVEVLDRAKVPPIAYHGVRMCIDGGAGYERSNWSTKLRLCGISQEDLQVIVPIMLAEAEDIKH
jgi:hypothetical protein